MTVAWKVIKVFISSTFQDFELTRDKLAQVFDKINHDLVRRQLIISFYDLRWRDRYSKEPIAKWCVRMVSECEHFIGILGNRYGWRPSTGADNNPNIQNISITEMEIETALQKVSQNKRFFCFSDFTKKEKESEEDINSVIDLKRRLKEKETVYECSSNKDLLLTIEKQFRKIIDAYYPKDKQIKPIVYDFHEVIDEKIKNFVGRDHYIDKLQEFVSASDSFNYLVIHALAGTGKSSLIAKFVQGIAEHVPIVLHYLGMGSQSRTVDGIIRGLAKQLEALGFFTNTLQYSETLIAQVHRALQRIKQPLILILDGIDEVSENGRDLSWLPRVLPSNVRVILTTREVDTWDTLQKFPVIKNLELKPLSTKEIQQIISEYAKDFQLNFSDQELDILIKKAHGSPLFLKVALDEIISSGIAVGELAQTVKEIFKQVLLRLQTDYDNKFQSTGVNVTAQEVINNYLGIIAAGRTGIMEHELKEIINIGDDFFLSITEALKSFVVCRSNLLNFFHPEFERMIKEQQGKSNMRLYHQRIAQYLQNKGYKYIRTLDELPYQLQWGEKYENLIKVLTDLRFLEAKANQNMILELKNDYEFALNGIAVRIPEELTFEIEEVNITRKILDLINKAIKHDIQFLYKHPKYLFQTLWNYGYWYDCSDINSYYKNSTDTKLHKSKGQFSLLVENWRNIKEKENTLWLKSKRPLPDHLDSPLLRTFRGHDNNVSSVSYSPDGSKIVSASDDNTIKVWDVQNGSIILNIEGHTHNVSSVNYSPDGSQIVSASDDKTIKIWNAENGCLCMNLKEHTGSVNNVQYSLDGNKIVSVSDDKTVKIWDAQSGQLLLSILVPAKVECLTCSPNNDNIATGSSDGLIRIWNKSTGEFLCKLEGHKGSIRSIVYSRNGSTIVSGSEDNTIKIWNTSNNQVISTLCGHEYRVTSVNVSSDGSKIISGADDKTIRIWDTLSEKLISIFLGHGYRVSSVSYSPDGNQIVSGSWDKTIKIWDANNLSIPPDLEGHEYRITSISYSPDGQQAVSSAKDKKLCLWNLQTGRLKTSFIAHEKKINSVSYSPDGSKIVSASDDKTVKIWDVQNSKLYMILEGHAKSVNDAQYNHDNNRIISASEDKTIKVWDAQNGGLLSTINTNDSTFTSVRYSSDSSKVVSGLNNGLIKVWDIHSQKLLLTINGHKGAVKSLGYSEDDMTIASFGKDKKLQIWDAQNGKNLKTLDGYVDTKTIGQNSYKIQIHNGETQILSNKYEVIAVFPAFLGKATVSTEGIVSGESHRYMYILELQGPSDTI